MIRKAIIIFQKDIDENYKYESLLVSAQLRLPYQLFFSLRRASSRAVSSDPTRDLKWTNYVNQPALAT